jgi:hypothetical protein
MWEKMLPGRLVGGFVHLEGDCGEQSLGRLVEGRGMMHIPRLWCGEPSGTVRCRCQEEVE